MSNVPTSSKTDPMRTGRPSESTGSGQGMVQNVMEQGRAAMESAADYGRNAMESVSRTSASTYTSFRDQVERNPVTSVLSAVAIGFVLGALWRSPPRHYGYYSSSLPSRGELEGWFNDLMRSASRQFNRQFRHYNSGNWTGSNWRWW
jgi:hypothetical protein